MPTTHIVKQGEFLASIATGHGVSCDAIWNDPSNAKLRQKRVNPNVLFPGDTLIVPDVLPHKVKLRTGERHLVRLTLNSDPLILRFEVRGEDDMPIANTGCQLQLDGKVYHLITDKDGKLEQVISTKAQEGTLTVLNLTMPIRIGSLDPVKELSGQIARLNNLGYDAGDSETIDEQQFLSAIEEFQCDHSLTVDGKCGPITQKKLSDVHGC